MIWLVGIFTSFSSQLYGGTQLSPLFYLHVNPYGKFDLDMNSRLPLAV